MDIYEPERAAYAELQRAHRDPERAAELEQTGRTIRQYCELIERGVERSLSRDERRLQARLQARLDEHNARSLGEYRDGGTRSPGD